MVVVPAFAHADQTSEPDIVALGSHAIDDPALAAPSMGEMADQPVAGHADADPDEDAPDQPAPAADDEEQDRPGQLLPHPLRSTKA